MQIIAFLKSLLGFSKVRTPYLRRIASYTKVQLLWSEIIRNKSVQLKKIDLTKEVYCNVGCGGNILPGFINIDYSWIPNLNLCWDVLKGLPFRDKSVDGIFIEHCLEHFSINETKKILQEFRRVLKNGHIIRIVVPDGELYVNLYIKSKADKSIRFPYQEESNAKMPMFYLNKAFRRDRHKFTYDADTLIGFLSEIGFTDIRKESFMQGRDNRLLIDTGWRKFESLYIEASA